MGVHTELPSECLERGIHYKAEGDYDRAIVEFQKVLEIDPTNVPARVQLGLVYCFTGQFNESLHIFREALEIDSTDLDIHNSLGLTYAMLGKDEEAKAEFAFVLARDPKNEIASRNIVYL